MAGGGYNRNVGRRQAGRGPGGRRMRESERKRVHTFPRIYITRRRRAGGKRKGLRGENHLHTRIGNRSRGYRPAVNKLR